MWRSRIVLGNGFLSEAHGRIKAMLIDSLNDQRASTTWRQYYSSTGKHDRLEPIRREIFDDTEPHIARRHVQALGRLRAGNAFNLRRVHGRQHRHSDRGRLSTALGHLGHLKHCDRSTGRHYLEGSQHPIRPSRSKPPAFGCSDGKNGRRRGGYLCCVFDRRVLNCSKKHRPRQALETNSPIRPSDVTLIRHFRGIPFLSPGIIFLFAEQPCRLSQALDFE